MTARNVYSSCCHNRAIRVFQHSKLDLLGVPQPERLCEPIRSRRQNAYACTTSGSVGALAAAPNWFAKAARLRNAKEVKLRVLEGTECAVVAARGIDISTSP